MSDVNTRSSRQTAHDTSRVTGRRTVTLLIGCLALLGRAGDASADVSTTIAEIERMPRAKRLAAYEDLADRRGLSGDDRVELIRKFAAHAQKVSPAFGRSSHRIDTARWKLMLEYALKREPKDKVLLTALCQLLIDEQKYRDALPVTEAFVAAFRDDHAAQAWSRWCRSKTSGADPQPAPENLPEFPLHFCVLTRNPAARKATREQCLKEVELLNAGFRQADGQPLVKFRLESFSAYSDIQASTSPLLEFGDSKNPYSSANVVRAFNATNDPAVRNPRAINVYIFDSYSPRVQFADKTSHGTRNSNRPYVLLDWERLDGDIQNPLPHEMGHAFGLGHVGVPGARGDTSTNIMASSGESFGSGGKRDLGFTESQAALILYHAQRTSSRLGLPSRPGRTPD